MTHRMVLIGTAFLTLSLGGCEFDRGDEAEAPIADPDLPVAIVRTVTLQWEGEQTYIPLYADGTASGLVVVNFNEGLLFGTLIPDTLTGCTVTPWRSAAVPLCSATTSGSRPWSVNAHLILSRVKNSTSMLTGTST